ncbi:hypothetical protein [Streptomyces sp. NPDC047718]|uniref:hypothetical protein n=1 Tax=Streptomyces sp. NPDC047718 TaxID=3155479 RepID=UPI0033C4107B
MRTPLLRAAPRAARRAALHPTRRAALHPTRRAALRTAPCAALLLVAGCGGGGGLVSAGTVPTASGPVQLWPGRQGATVPPADPGGAPAVYVPGLPPVRGQNVHEVDPVALVESEVAAGTAGVPPETAAAVEACGKEPAGACPVVLTPYYRDLTGNGREELVVGIDMPDGTGDPGSGGALAPLTLPGTPPPPHPGAPAHPGRD